MHLNFTHSVQYSLTTPVQMLLHTAWESKGWKGVNVVMTVLPVDVLDPDVQHLL